MAIELDHTLAPARDKVASAKFFARIFGLRFDASAVGYFAPVKANDALTMDFADNAMWTTDSGESDRVPVHHYAFKVSEEDFDAFLARIESEGIAYGSGPDALENMNINHRQGGRGVYFRDPDRHVVEALTVG